MRRETPQRRSPTPPRRAGGGPAAGGIRREFQGLEKPPARRPTLGNGRRAGGPDRAAARRRGLALALLAAAAAGPAAAGVFWVRGGADHGATTAGRPGWTRVHRAELEINGGRGEMEVLGVTLPAAAALDQLRAAYEGMGGEVFVGPGAAMGWGVARVGERIIRFLVVAPEGPRECVVFRLEQSADAFARSMRAPDRPADDVAGGRERRTVRDAERRIEARTIETPAPPAEAAAAVGRALQAEGWQPALPDAAGAGLFVRGRDLCVVRATAGAAAGAPTRVLMLVQRGSDF